MTYFIKTKKFTAMPLFALLSGFLLFLLIYPPGANAADGDYRCPVYSVKTGTQSIDLSNAFLQSTTTQTTLTTNWTGSATCSASKIIFYTMQPYSTPVYLKFTDATSASTWWIKLTVTGTPKTVSLNNTGSFTYSLANYPVTMTIKTELVDAPTGAVDTLTTSTGSITTGVIAYSNSSAETDASTRVSALADQWGIISWNGVQRLTFTFKPKATTCSAADKAVSLPEVSLSKLRSGKVDGSTAFTLDLTCNSGLVDRATNPVKMWLSSNDIVDSANTIIHNSSSTAPGVGIGLLTASQEPVVFADGNGTAGTTLLAMSAGDKLSSYNYKIPLTARYRIYDNKKANVGSISATATVMFSWE